MSRLAAVNVSISFGSLVVLDGVSLSIGPGDRIGIVAPNGVGKSTLLRVLAGELEPDSGRVTRSPATTTVLRLAQEPDIRPGESLAGHLERRTQVAAAQADLDASLAGLARRSGRRRRRLRRRLAALARARRRRPARAHGSGHRAARAWPTAC